MGGMTVYDKVCVGVVLTSSFLSCDKSQPSPVDDIPQKETDDNWVPFGEYVWIKRVQRKPLLPLLFSKCLQLEVLNIPEQRILG